MFSDLKRQSTYFHDDITMSPVSTQAETVHSQPALTPRPHWPQGVLGNTPGKGLYSGATVFAIVVDDGDGSTKERSYCWYMN